jgi:hypothetical protein
VRQRLEARQSQQAAEPPPTEDSVSEDWSNTITGSFLSKLNPLPTFEAAYDEYSRRLAEEQDKGSWFPRINAAVGTAGAVGRGMEQAQMQRLQKGYEAYKGGRKSEAVGQTLAGVTPLVGPPAAEAGEQIGAGEYRKGIGAGLALTLPSALTLAAPALPAEVGPKVRLLRSQLNPVEQSAVNFGERAGIPMDVATRTGGKSSRIVQEMAGKTPLGSLVGGRARAAQEAGLAKAMEDLRQSVGSQQQLGAHVFSPEDAGGAVHERLNARISTLHTAADQAYGQLRQIEQDPANIQRVTLGQQQVPVTTPGRGVTGINTVPIAKDIAIPIDMRGVKKALAPIYQEMLESMPIAQQQASPGLKALQNILQGEDVIPASAAERNLGALKGITRQADSPLSRNVSQGLAAKAIAEVEDTVQGAVRAAGPDATQALNRGRARTRAKYEAIDLLNRVSGGQEKPELVGIFKRLTRGQDQGVQLLREVQQVAPQEMPKLGRAVLQEMLAKAEREGGFKRTAGLQADWARLGTETKKMLFSDPRVRQNLDDFFLLAKRMAENPNPSGTGPALATFETIREAPSHPVAVALASIGSAMASRLLMSDAGSSALVNGMRLPLRGPVQSAATITRIARALANMPPPEAEAPTPPPGEER